MTESFVDRGIVHAPDFREGALSEPSFQMQSLAFLAHETFQTDRGRHLLVQDKQQQELVETALVRRILWTIHPDQMDSAFEDLTEREMTAFRRINLTAPDAQVSQEKLRAEIGAMGGKESVGVSAVTRLRLSAEKKIKTNSVLTYRGQASLESMFLEEARNVRTDMSRYPEVVDPGEPPHNRKEIWDALSLLEKRGKIDEELSELLASSTIPASRLASVMSTIYRLAQPYLQEGVLPEEIVATIKNELAADWSETYDSRRTTSIASVIKSALTFSQRVDMQRTDLSQVLGTGNQATRIVNLFVGSGITVDQLASLSPQEMQEIKGMNKKSILILVDQLRGKEGYEGLVEKLDEFLEAKKGRQLQKRRYKRTLPKLPSEE